MAGPYSSERARLEAMLERQLRSYDQAPPRSRFAVAAHITRTRRKLAQLETREARMSEIRTEPAETLEAYNARMRDYRRDHLIEWDA